MGKWTVIIIDHEQDREAHSIHVSAPNAAEARRDGLLVYIKDVLGLGQDAIDHFHPDVEVVGAIKGKHEIQ